MAWATGNGWKWVDFAFELLFSEVLRSGWSPSGQALVEALAEDDAAKRGWQLHAVQRLVEALPKCQAGKALRQLDSLLMAYLSRYSSR